MKPYYEHGGISIFHGDALQVLAELPDRAFDALLTDPPYCSGGYLEAQKNTPAQGLRGATVRADDFEWFGSDNLGTAGLAWLLRSMMAETRRLLLPNRSAFVFTDWRMIPIMAPAIESSGLRYRNMLVWDKGNAGLGVGFKPAHELIMEFANGSTEYQVLDGQNVLRFARLSASAKTHRAEKPVSLVAEIIRVATPLGGAILDPFLGSGSSLFAARKWGRRAVGIDVSEACCEIAATRLAQEVLPLEVAA